MTGFMLLALILALCSGCSRGSSIDQPEETIKKPEDVPIHIRTAVEGYCKRLGINVQWRTWMWDSEDDCWECLLRGLGRRAELDVAKDGRFLELELVYDFVEIENALPEVASRILAKCRSRENVLIELSLRHDSFLDEVPDLAEAWTMNNVVIEFQCANGSDFEIDAHGKGRVQLMDDLDDPR